MFRRIALTEWIAEHHSGIEVHLLGLGHPSGLAAQAHHRFIVSHDYSYAAMSGIGRGRRLAVRDIGPHDEPYIDWEAPYDPVSADRARANIATVRALLVRPGGNGD